MTSIPSNLRHETLLANASAEQLARINHWCDQFESQWTGSPVDWHQTLERVESELRDAVVTEMVIIDVELRSKRNLPLVIEDYLRPLPQLDQRWLKSLLAQRQSAQQQQTIIALNPGQLLGDYRILLPLGEGGMGQVYRAEHVLMKRQVAIKVIQPQAGMQSHLQRRFEREVQAVARLSHPNIVVAHDARMIDGCLYLVTELIEGEDIGSLVERRGCLAPIFAVHFAGQAAKGLAYSHQMGIVHRDIKPENLFVTKHNQVKILDLGLARLLESDSDPTSSTLTNSFQVFGTAAFISPEQARCSATADGRSDVYSLGCTLYFMLRGEPPYPNRSQIDTILAHISGPIPSISANAAGHAIPPALDQLLQEMLAKDPSDRPQNMQQVVDRLAAIFQSLRASGRGPLSPVSGFHRLIANSASARATLKRLATGNRAPAFAPARNRINRRLAIAFSYTAIALAALALLALFLYTNSQTSDVPTPDRLMNAASPGLRFRGDGYFEVDDFALPTSRYFAIEALVSPGLNTRPTNIVTWTGSRSLAVFRAESQQWGAAYFDGRTPRLILADRVIARRDSHELLAAVWNGQHLELYLDGSPLASTEIRYNLFPTATKLLIGGVPDGFIPYDPGRRFFNGDICAVRISDSESPILIASRPVDLAVNDQTKAFFDFSNAGLVDSQGIVTDLTERWRGNLNWISPTPNR